MTKKELGRGIAFILVVCLMLGLLCEVFELSDTGYIPTRFKTFYDLNEDTLDAVWIGTSGVDRYWVPSKAYEEYGMTVFTLSSDAMPPWLFTNVVDEILETQSPELIIVDIRAFCQTTTVKAKDQRARRVLDAMNPFSINRLKAAFKTMNTATDPNKKSSFDLSYLLSYIKYHSMWADEDFSIVNNTSNEKNEYLGLFMHKNYSIKTKSQTPSVFETDYYVDLDSYAVESLYEFIEYAKEKNLNVLFVNTPNHMKQEEVGRTNTLYRMLDEYGLDYINYCETDENGKFTLVPEMDSSTDFYNRNHVNYYGAEKFTDVFAEYLDTNYDFADHRNDPAVTEQWDGNYEKVQATIKKWEDEAAAKK